MKSQKVRKAVIAAAGFGTRFLPQTKAMPKEMLPLVDKPIIQYVVEQLVEAGITDIIVVTGSSKRSLEDHFDEPSEDLLTNLRAGGAKKAPLIQEIRAIADLANFIYVRQKGSYGAARPLMCAAHLIGDEPFIYTYADDLIVAEPNRFQQMVTLYDEFQAPILPCIRAATDDDFEKYGIISGTPVHDGVIAVSNIVEKPGRGAAGSSFASIGGYLLTPDYLTYLERSEHELTPGQEFQAQPAMRAMIAAGKPLYAALIQRSMYYDTGSKAGYLKAVFDFAMARPDIAPELSEYLHSKLK